MEKKVLIFGKKYFNKNVSHRCKEPITTDKVDIRKIVLSKKDSYGNRSAFKYFIGYISNRGIIPLCIILPQMNEYVKCVNKNSKYMNILVHDKEVLKKYDEIWDEIKSLFKKEFDSELVYSDKYIKTKGSLCNINIYGNKTPKEGKYYTCFSVILLDSIINVDKKYYPQVFLEECKYAAKKRKIMSTIKEELKLDKVDDESYDEFDKCRNICDGLH